MSRSFREVLAPVILAGVLLGTTPSGMVVVPGKLDWSGECGESPAGTVVTRLLSTEPREYLNLPGMVLPFSLMGVSRGRTAAERIDEAAAASGMTVHS